ncbi:MAG: DUF4382 domain-containing protein [Armatimonadota bacterium]|nr:MAG: DUF4382 domain-containing protein [Armatimonadota bacterium]
MGSRIPLIALGVLLAAAAVLGAGGCGSSSGTVSTGTGQIAILLTDQAGEFEQVLVTVAEVRVHRDGGGWVTVADKAAIDAFITQPVDLLSLRDVEKLIGVASLPAGRYTQLRLVLLPQAEVVLPGGAHQPLKIPSGPQTGLKALNFTVPDGEVVYLLIDIETDRITHTDGGANEYILPPTAISVTVFNGPFGMLRGAVSPPDSEAAVTAYWAGTNVPVAQMTINPDGTYAIPDLLDGWYYLLVSAVGYEPFDSRPALYEVVPSGITDVPLITLTPLPPPTP